jgi:hypothetical protein
VLIATGGANNPEKHEIAPSRASGGDLNHLLREGVSRKTKCMLDLAHLVAGRKIGRTAKEALVIFDRVAALDHDLARKAHPPCMAGDVVTPCA